MKPQYPSPHLLALLLLLPSLFACGKEDASPGGPQEKNAPPSLVESATVSLGPITRELEQSGTLKALREVRIVSQEEGMITAMPHREGDQVKEGEQLVALDDRLLQAQLNKASAQRRDAELARARLERLQKSRAVSEEELAQAATAVDVARAEEAVLRTRLGHTRIASPFTGVITTREAEVGDALPRFSHLLTLVDPASLYTEIALSELVLPSLHPGDAVTVRIDALGNQRLHGEILRLHPAIDPLSHQGIVEVLLTPLPTGAMPGQLCRVTLTLQLDDRLTIPYSALRRDLLGEFVYRIDEQLRIHRTAVTSGLHLGDRVEIIAGLEAGMQVVSKGFLGLGEGSAVTIANAPPSGTP